jgi:HAE1 family hydrophobic/amphiphilic exporter-1
MCAPGSPSKRPVMILIENQISTASGLDSVLTYSMANVSIVTAAFEMGKDENMAVQEIKEKVCVIF